MEMTSKATVTIYMVTFTEYELAALRSVCKNYLAYNPNSEICQMFLNHTKTTP